MRVCAGCKARPDHKPHPKQTLISYRIFSIKRRGVYLKLGRVDPAFIRTWRGVYSGPGFYLLNAFFSIGSLLSREPKFNKNV